MALSWLLLPLSLFHKGINHMHESSTSLPNHLLKAPSPNSIILRTRFQVMNFQDTDTQSKRNKLFKILNLDCQHVFQKVIYTCNINRNVFIMCVSLHFLQKWKFNLKAGMHYTQTFLLYILKIFTSYINFINYFSNVFITLCSLIIFILN